MANVTLFKNRFGSVAAVLATGQTVSFVNGRYWTENKAEQDALAKAAETEEFGIYVDPNEKTIDTEATTPLEMIKRQAVQEYLAKQQAGYLVDAGSSDSNNFAPVTTNSSEISGNVPYEIEQPGTVIPTTQGPQTQMQTDLGDERLPGTSNDSTQTSQAELARQKAELEEKAKSSNPAEKSSALSALEKLKQQSQNK